MDNPGKKATGIGGFLRWSATTVFCGAVLLGTARRSAASTTITVTTNSDAPVHAGVSLRDAIGVAGAGDTINFQAGLASPIVLAQGEIFTHKTLNITGPGAGQLTISGGNASRVFDFYNNGYGPTVNISGVTLTGGNAAAALKGGAIYARYTTLSLTDCVITGSTAAWGGGIFQKANPQTLTIQNCTISGNSAGNNGGGGIAMYGGHHLIMDNSTVSGNTTTGSGGGINGNNGVQTTITNSTISGNHASGSGGAIANSFTGSTYLVPFAPYCLLRNTTISGNSAGGFGGGLAYVRIVNPHTIQNCTITGNTSTGGAGGIYGYAHVSVSSTIVALNTTAGVADDIGVVAQSVGANGGVDHSLIGNGASIGIANGPNFNKTGTTAAPLNPQLLPLANNGGPTQTHALMPTSPAIDAGSNPTGLLFDQRGAPFTRQIAASFDIGAYERDTIPPTAALTSAPNVNNASNPNQYIFTVNFADNIGVNAASIGNTNILVTGPAGFSQLATLVSVVPPGNGTLLTATYKITPPGGFWAPTANGLYTITMLANQVVDTTGNPVAAGVLGTFSVAVLAFTGAPASGVISATPNPQLIGQPIQFNVSAAGVGPLTYSWVFGDGTSGTGSSISHAYTAFGAFTVQLTVKDGNGQTITASIVVNVVPLSFVSGPSATPNPATPAQVVQFIGVATGGQPVAYAWNFGDGSTGTGTGPTHAFAAPGVYVVNVVATDVNGLTVASTITVTVLDINGDNDGDGFTNDVELALGTDPLSAASTPFNLPKPTATGPVSVKRLKIQLKFGIPNSDSIAMTGTLPLPAGFKPLGQTLIFNIDHAIRAFKLDSRGFAALSTGKNGLLNDSLKVATRGNFTLKLSRGACQTALSSDADPARQLTSAQGTAKTRTLKVTIYFNNTVLSGDVTGQYKAMKGQFGK